MLRSIFFLANILVFIALVQGGHISAEVSLSSLEKLSKEPDSLSNGIDADWLIDPSLAKANVYQGERAGEIVLTNGLIRRVFLVTPNVGTIQFRQLSTGNSIIRGVKPEAEIRVNGQTIPVGGLLGQRNYAFLSSDEIPLLKQDPESMQCVGFEVGLPKERMAWKQVRHHASGVAWPPKGVALRFDYAMPESIASQKPELAKLTVSVHYELYDGIPVYSKWLTISNAGETKVLLNSYASDIMAAIEYMNSVEERNPVHYPKPNIHVETNYAFGGFTLLDTTKRSVHWKSDPQYQTQVNYERIAPCLLRVAPETGPAVEILSGQTFETIRAFVLPYDSFDRERQGLALRKMYRVIAPWVTENPLMLHARFADWDCVKKAIDQCAEVGFEMVILTFGSGFDVENNSEEYIAKMKKYADYAKSKGVEIGGYSLLASRKIDEENDVINPKTGKPGGFATFGNSPCICSKWGQDYFAKLYNFYKQTGFNLLEHDGSYPGDVCASKLHPGHNGLEDSQYRQWETITDFYKWCRGQGIYLNVPDYYYLSGSSKCSMGYREVNWSLPRAQQVIHTRQNIYDGTWEKTPSMGWMFVPLTQYHGGGDAATIEPLHEHLDHYRQMILGNLGFGVQACYRGPRLYDTEETKQMVAKAVAWFKKYRGILESDLIHGQRADGQDIDWMLHVNPSLKEKGLAMFFNPTDAPIEKTITLPLYYTGLDEKASIRQEEGNAKEYVLDHDYKVKLKVRVPAKGSTWFVIE